MIPKRLILAIALLALGSGLGAGKIIQPDDKSGDDIRAAATQFLNDLADGKEKEVRAEFVGSGDAAKLLDRMINCVALTGQWQSALKHHFGDSMEDPYRGADRFIRDYVKSIPRMTIPVNDAGTAASISCVPSNTELIQGVELKKIDGKWRVTYPCALHDRHELLLVVEMDAANGLIPALLTRLKKGDFPDYKSATDALADGAETKIAAVAATQPALIPPAADTQPAAKY